MLGMLRHMAAHARSRKTNPSHDMELPEKVYLVWSARSQTELALLDQELIDLARSALCCYPLCLPCCPSLYICPLKLPFQAAHPSCPSRLLFEAALATPICCGMLPVHAAY